MCYLIGIFLITNEAEKISMFIGFFDYLFKYFYYFELGYFLLSGKCLHIQNSDPFLYIVQKFLQ